MINFQTMTIIFVLLIVPMTIILGFYIDSQIDAITLVNSYNSKLLISTYDAITALQLNTINNGDSKLDNADAFSYSTNAEALRRDINASANVFTTSLAKNFGKPGYGKNAILPYVPALVYTLYDGYYIYSPMNVPKEGNPNNFEHVLKPFIYYTARYYKDGGNYDFVVNYSLDNYIVIYGKVNGVYCSKAGYLTVPGKYNGITLTDEEAKKYLNDSIIFTTWVKDNLSDIKACDIVADVSGRKVITAEHCANEKNSLYEFKTKTYKILNVGTSNDPELKASDFTEHKNAVIKKSIEKNLQDAINNYSEFSQAFGTNYSFMMPILSQSEWDKILSNVSLISFLQGLPVGYSVYNKYMIVSSNGNYLTSDPEELYFVNKDADGNEGKYYHKINCPLLVSEYTDTSDDFEATSIEGFKNISYKGISNNIKTVTTTGVDGQKYYAADNSYYILGEDGKYVEKYYKSGSKFFSVSVVDGKRVLAAITAPSFTQEYEEQRYTYNNHTSLACYECIVAPKTGATKFEDANNLLSLPNASGDNIKKKLRAAYYNALFKERYKQVKVSQYVNKS